MHGIAQMVRLFERTSAVCQLLTKIHTLQFAHKISKISSINYLVTFWSEIKSKLSRMIVMLFQRFLFGFNRMNFANFFSKISQIFLDKISKCLKNGNYPICARLELKSRPIDSKVKAGMFFIDLL